MAILGKGLRISQGSSTDFEVEIRAVDKSNDAKGNPNNNEDEGCGKSYACVKPKTVTGTDSAGPGQHMGTIYMVLEDPPKSYDPVTGNHIVWEWTNDPNVNEGDYVQGTMNPMRFYVKIDRVMRHEFGHTLGLHDFYLDQRMNHLDAVMNIGDAVTDEDLAQLRAIYLLHSSH